MVREGGIDGDLIGPVAVEETGGGQGDVLAMHHRDRHPRPVAGFGPRRGRGVVGRVEVTEHRSCLEERSRLSRARSICKTLLGCDHRRPAEAERGDVRLGIGAQPDRRGLSVEGTIQLRGEEVPVQRVASVPSGSTRTTVSASARSLSTITVGEGIDVLDPHPAPQRHDLAPGVLPSVPSFPSAVVRTGQDPEVLGLVVGQDEEPARAGVTRPGKVVDGVLDPLAAGSMITRGRRSVRRPGWPATPSCWCCAGPPTRRPRPGCVRSRGRSAGRFLRRRGRHAPDRSPDRWRHSWWGRWASSKRT